MNTNRIHYSRQIENELRSLETYKKRTVDTIHRYESSGVKSDDIKKQIDLLTNKISDYDVKIEEKKKMVEEIRSGLRDNEIKSTINKNSKVANRKHQDHVKRRKDEQDELDIAKEKADKYFQRGKGRSKKRRPASTREIDNEYKRYLRNCAKIPDYMKRNLADMPNNKGYIWKNIWLMGERDPEKGQPNIMFERKGKDLLVIYEINEYERKIYEKRGKSRRVLVKTIPRRVIH